MSITVVRYDVWPVGGDGVSDAKNVTLIAASAVSEIQTPPRR